MSRKWFGVLAVGLSVVLAASASRATDSRTEFKATPLTPTETLQSSAKLRKPTQSIPTDPFLRRVTTQAIDDLAGRLALPVARIEFVELKPMLWPDSGLGCPRPGMVYPQVQQDGYLIRLRAGKHEFAYHGGGRRGPFLCEKGS
jgi:hypothetical protein